MKNKATIASFFVYSTKESIIDCSLRCTYWTGTPVLGNQLLIVLLGAHIEPARQSWGINHCLYSQVHILNRHASPGESFGCMFCGKHLSSRSSLQVHISQVYTFRFWDQTRNCHYSYFYTFSYIIYCYFFLHFCKFPPLKRNQIMHF